MKKYIIVTLRECKDPRMVAYGTDLCVVQEYRIWEKVDGCGWAPSFKPYISYEKTVVRGDALNCPVPFFDSYQDAQKYFTEHFEELKSKIDGVKYRKMFTRVTTIEKLEGFRKIARNGKPYSFFKNNQEDNKYLDEVLGPRLI